MFCKDRNGNWKQQEGKVSVAPTPQTSSAPQYADATYRGVAVWNVPVRQRQRAARNLSDLVTKSMQATTKKEEIFVSTTMRINGSAVTGTITGGSWQSNVPITGTRQNGVCNISGTLNGQTVAYVGKCDASGFSGQMNQYGTGGEGLKGTFNLQAASFTDTTARDAERAELERLCDGGNGLKSACVKLDQTK